MIKYDTGLPMNIPSNYKWYVELETNIMYLRNGNLWEVYSPVVSEVLVIITAEYVAVILVAVFQKNQNKRNL